jgi:hypothetical protein
MDSPTKKLAVARKYDAKVLGLVADKRRNMARLAYLLVEIRDQGLHEALGESTIAKYAVTRGVTGSRTHARDLLLVGERVRKWPLIKAAFDRGELDWTKLREGLRALERTGHLPGEVERWLQRVRECTARKLEELAARACGQEPAVTQTFRHAPERQARLEQALQKVRARGTGKETDADALAQIIEEWTAGVTSARPWDPSTLVVIHRCAECGKTTTNGREGPVEVPPASFERQHCNAATLDIRDGPADVKRTIPKKIARYVWHRDGGRCRVDGCNEAAFVHIHHEGGWAAIGHDPRRMFLLCPRHHAARHEGLLQVRFVDEELQLRLADGSPPIASREAVAVPAPPAQAG